VTIDTSEPADRADIASAIRVDHAGEYGAVRIYEGQLAVLGRSAAAPALRDMRRQELEHLATFTGLLGERQVRPTMLLPLWHVAGYALGAGTALLGERAAMACTVAVEDAVVAHYDTQLKTLDRGEAALGATIARVRDEEQDHRDHAADHGASDAPGYRFLYGAIRLGCAVAIRLSQRI
jgi:ubiquinone biosynthesis monooxygenase Coq7